MAGHTVTSLSVITSVEMRTVWKNAAEYNGDCVDIGVNGESVWAGVETNNGFTPDADHGAEICQAGDALEGGAVVRSAARVSFSSFWCFFSNF